METLEKVGQEILKRLNKCNSSENFQVAERSLFMFNNDKINWLLRNYKQHAFPIVIEGLMKNSSSHWNPTVQGLTFYVLKILVEIDSQLFDNFSEYYQKRSQSVIIERAKTEQKWRRLEIKSKQLQ